MIEQDKKQKVESDFNHVFEKKTKKTKGKKKEKKAYTPKKH